MLTIILKILGILGILILVILGLALLLLMLVFFVPVTYRVKADRKPCSDVGSGTGTTGDEEPGEYVTRIVARANWLFGLLRVRFLYPEPGTVTVKALGFTLLDSGVTTEQAGGRAKDKTEEKTEENKAEAKEEAKTESKIKTGSKNETESKPETRSKATTEEKAEDRTEDRRNAEDKAVKGDTPKRNPLEKIQYTLRKICDKIEMICEKIKEVYGNISHYKEIFLCEDNRGLINHAFRRLDRILKSIRPRKLHADIRFGTGSPDTTGYAFGVYGILCAGPGRHVILTPDFERAVLEGEIYAAGHITVFTVLWHGLWVALDKRLWELVSKLKE